MQYIYWSGGLDSTYLLCKIARNTTEQIQPVYIIFPETSERGAANLEMSAQNDLLPLIRAENGITATILKPIQIKEKDIPQDVEFESAYERMYNEDILSKHYMYRSLGKLAKQYPGIMIGIEAPPPNTRVNNIGKTEEAITSYGIKIADDGTLMLEENGNKDMYTIFGNMKFCMVHINAIDELKALHEWGYDDLIPLCRTCCTTLPQQCGVCSNCEIKMRYGDTFKKYMPRAYVNYQVKQYLRTINEKYATLYTIFVWGGGHLRSGRFTSNASGHTEDFYLSTTTVSKLEEWFNLLLDNYPNFDNVNRADCGIE